MTDYFDGEAPTKLDLVLSILQKTGTTETYSSVHAQSVRMPTITFASIEALAAYSGHSKNKVICQLLEVALEEVWGALDKKNLKEISKLRSQILAELVAKESELAQAEPGEC